jgi:hypothetical protein
MILGNVWCESVATQRPSSVDFVDPQRARHNTFFKICSKVRCLKLFEI